jgi:hypothetical protein
MRRITTAHRDRAILADLFEAASRRGRPRDPSAPFLSSPFVHYAVDLIGTAGAGSVRPLLPAQARTNQPVSSATRGRLATVTTVI